MESLQGERKRFLYPFVQESRQMAHPSLTKAFLQAAATTTMHCQTERWTHPPPPIPPFLLVQNLSSKRIAPTDNMQPNLTTPKGVIDCSILAVSYRTSSMLLSCRVQEIWLHKITNVYTTVYFKDSQLQLRWGCHNA